MLGRVFNEDSFDTLRDIANECVNPVLVTDPPFNVGYHYASYHDRMDEDEYFQSLAQMVNEYPSVVVLYPEALHRLSMQAGKAPERVVSWVYPSNTRRQHRDIGFYGINPDFSRVRRPYRNPNDKRVKKLMERTGGASSYDWLEVNQIKNVSKEKTVHPCQMPLAVMRDVVSWVSWVEGVTIIDPFAGSGTTCVACEEAGIPWVAIEIDPTYCDLIWSRVSQTQPTAHI